ncbi:tyrosine-type recombinase/integrase [Salsuginibacillus kocurii]|uniref:tyrosine-type recombinase/integrase n=1 Tax=Salsuginibacillus kocurii TaxID=427078 RepID=UPI000370F291|nr:tyrosine-type recombinase/integrase [Salsuginibacillus kocurii]
MLLKFAIQDFLSDRKFRNLSQTTINSYEYTLQIFHQYAVHQCEITDVTDIRTDVIKAFLVNEQEVQKNKPASINTKLKNLNAFFNYMIEIEVIESNPAKKLKKQKEDIHIDVFTDHHIRKMLDYYKRQKRKEYSFYAYRNYTIIVFLLGTGVRLGEMCNLRWSDVDFERKQISIFGKKRMVNTLPITDKLTKDLAEYRMFCESHFGALSDYVFVNQKNERLTENAVQNVFKYLSKMMNFRDVRLSAHTFRHTFAHRYLMNGGDVFSLQKLLRHEKLDMVEKYLALWGEDLQEQNEKYNPMNHLDI